MRISKGFTLVEILVVATIIMVLAGIGFVSYTSLAQQSRNSRRQADLQNLRSALEFYRSDQDVYPTGTSTDHLSVLDTENYINSIPDDPKADNPNYCYLSADGTTYELCAKMEDDTANINCCGGDATYNFKLTPLGEE